MRKKVLWTVLVIAVGYSILYLIAICVRPNYSNLEAGSSDEQISTVKRLSDTIPSIGGDVPLIPTPTPVPTPNTYFPTPSATATPTPVPTPAIIVIPTPVASVTTPTPAPERLTQGGASSTTTATPSPVVTTHVESTPTPATDQSSSEEPASDANKKVVTIIDDSAPIEKKNLPAENSVTPADLANGVKITDGFDDFAVAIANGLNNENNKKGLDKKAFELDSDTGDYKDQSVYDNPLYITALYGEAKKQGDSLVGYFDKCIGVDGASSDCSGYSYTSTCPDSCMEQVTLSDEDLIDTQEWLNNRMDFLNQRYNQVVASDLDWEENPQTIFSDDGQKLDLSAVPRYNPSALYEMTDPNGRTKDQLLIDIEKNQAKLEEIANYESSVVSLSDKQSSTYLSVPNSNLSDQNLKIENKYPTVGAMAKAKNKYTWQNKINSEQVDYLNTPQGKLAKLVLAPVKFVKDVTIKIGDTTVDSYNSVARFINSKNKNSRIIQHKKNSVCKQKKQNTVKVPKTKTQAFYDTYGKSVVVSSSGNEKTGAKGAVQNVCENENKRKLSDELASRNSDMALRVTRLFTVRTIPGDAIAPEMVVAKDILTINQRDYADLSYASLAHPKATIASGGCGVVAGAIAVGNIYKGTKEIPDNILNLAKNAIVNQIRDAAVKNGDRWAEGTGPTLFTKTLPSLYDVKTVSLAKQPRSVILGYLANNIPVIMNGVGDAPFTENGHYIVAISGARVKNAQGVMEDYVYISDPNGGKVKMYRYDDFADRIVMDKLFAIVPGGYKVEVVKKSK